MAQACESCTYYDSKHSNGGAKAADAGLCRYNPPVSQPAPDGQGLWPVVTKEDWCGHYASQTTAH